MQAMTYIIFAGGAGTRLWPMSRKNSPKQFSLITNNQSTLQMAVERIAPFGMEHIYISTNGAYLDLVKQQVPALATDHIFLEPEKRDQAPAVGLSLLRLRERGITGPVAILWADHLMEYPDQFREALTHAKELIINNPNRFVFIGERPRFANHNLGWIHTGQQTGEHEYAFLGWKYRPDLAECEAMFDSGEWLWNTGYFVTDIDFLIGLYERLQPAMYTALCAMVKDEQQIHENYAELESISFDNAIVEKTDLSEGTVIPVHLGWSDPGTLYAFKEAFTASTSENYTVGNVCDMGSTDSFMYNEEKNTLVTTIGLEGMIVVNTKDAVLVCKKEDVPKVKELLKKIEQEGKGEYL